MVVLMKASALFAFSLCLRVVGSASTARLKPLGLWRQTDSMPGRPSTVNCTWQTFQQKIDHFGNTPGTFPQRYCIYSKWWGEASNSGFRVQPGTYGPILFYTGNESPVEEYVNNTGFMWEIGQRLGALLVFAEHRYEPLSHPALCGQGTQNCLAFCTTAQALADYASLISFLRQQRMTRVPVIAFGGSYGGMLAGWFRMKYPEVVDGAIAASAPIWQLSSTVERHTLDLPAVAITKGVSAAGGATDQCFENIRAAWPLLEQVGRSTHGLSMLSNSVRSCKPLKSYRDVTPWAQAPFFNMAEGNYPFPSTYISDAVGPGQYPLPAWPMRVACDSLNKDFGITLRGSATDVKYTLTLGSIDVSVDWNNTVGNGASLTTEQIQAAGVLDLAEAIANAAGVWYNVTKDKTCFDIENEELGSDSTDAPAVEVDDNFDKNCPACPPCADCPPCPVSRCKQTEEPCSFNGTLDKTFSWEGISCNDDLSQISVQGVGRDLYWPPSVSFRNYTVEGIVGPHQLRQGCAEIYDSKGLRGAPAVSDPWSGWLTAYYGGRNITHHRNIVWSNGALDPWSGMGVYPPGGGPQGPMVQNVNSDGSQIALVLDLGAHHLDLMFSDPREPSCAKKARMIEEERIREWCQEAYNAISTTPIIVM